MPRKASGLKKGGQPGNLNRLKHGFYSQRLKYLEVEAVESLRGDVDEELALVRALVRRLMELGEGTTDVEKLSRLLDVTSRAALRIGSLVRTRYILNGRTGDGSMSGVIQRVLGEMLLEEREGMN